MPEVNVGSTANDNTGDPLRTAFVKINTDITALKEGLSAIEQVPDATALIAARDIAVAAALSAEAFANGYLTPEAYGATGGANDRTALVAWLNALTATGKTGWVGRDFFFDSSIVHAGAVKIRGPFSDNARLVYTGTGDGLEFTGAVDLDGVVVDGNLAPDAVPTATSEAGCLLGIHGAMTGTPGYLSGVKIGRLRVQNTRRRAALALVNLSEFDVGRIEASGTFGNAFHMAGLKNGNIGGYWFDRVGNLATEASRLGAGIAMYSEADVSKQPATWYVAAGIQPTDNVDIGPGQGSRTTDTSIYLHDTYNSGVGNVRFAHYQGTLIGKDGVKFRGGAFNCTMSSCQLRKVGLRFAVIEDAGSDDNAITNVDGLSAGYDVMGEWLDGAPGTRNFTTAANGLNQTLNQTPGGLRMNGVVRCRMTGTARGVRDAPHNAAEGHGVSFRSCTDSTMIATIENCDGHIRIGALVGCELNAVAIDVARNLASGNTTAAVYCDDNAAQSSGNRVTVFARETSGSSVADRPVRINGNGTGWDVDISWKGQFSLAGQTGLRADSAEVKTLFVRPIDLIPIKSPVSPKWFTGYTEAFNGDATAALQAAALYASEQNRTLRIDAPLTISDLLLQPGQRIECDGPRYDVTDGTGAGLRLKRGTGTTDYDDLQFLVRLDPSISAAEWAFRGVQLYNLNIFGDMFMNVNGLSQQLFCGGIYLDNSSSPDASVNPRHLIEGGFLRDIPGDGVRIGNRTYDSQYKGITIHRTMGHGFYYGGVDSEISGVNAGRSYGHAFFLRGSELRIANCKGWLAGYLTGEQAQSGNPGTNPSIDPMASDAFHLFRNNGVVGVNLLSQECARYGLNIPNTGEASVGVPWGPNYDITITNFDSDGDNRQGAAGRSGIYVHQGRRITICGNVSKRNPAFLGGPAHIVHTGTDLIGCKFDVNGEVTSWAVNPVSAFENNDYLVNNHRSKVVRATVGSSYTTNPFDAERFILTMGENNLTISSSTSGGNPVPVVGWRMRMEFLPTSATPRTITFNSAHFLTPTGWAPTSTIGKRALINFVFNGSRWVAESFVNET